MQIFYVNIGGGEPTIRSDFWELVDYATAHHVGVKFSTNGSRITEEVAARLAASDYVDVQISLDGATRRGQRRRAGRRLVRHRRHRHGAPGRRRLHRLQALGGGHPPQRRPARRLQGPGRPLRGPAPADPAAAVGPGGRRVGRAPPDGRPAARALRLAGGPRRGRPDRRLVLPPGRPTATPCPGSTSAAPAGWSAWSTRSATSTPARSPSTTSSWPATCATAGGFTAVWRDVRPVRSSSGAPQSAGRLRVVRPLRRLPGRLHGGQVLHRPPARRPRPRVRPRPRRARPRRPRGRPSRPAPSPDHSSRPAPGRRWPYGRSARRPARPALRRDPLAGLAAPRPRPTDRDRPGRAGRHSARRHGALPGGLRPPRDQPRRRPGHRAAPRRLLRGPGRRRAPASSSPRRPRSTRRTGPTSGPRWPPPAGRAGRRWPRPADPTAPLVLAGLGHAGGQGSSAYSQSVLWAPSPVADVVSREMPMAMGRAEIDAAGRRVRRRRPAGRRRRARRRRGRRRAAVAAPPVPLGSHQPARRRLRRRTACRSPARSLDAVRRAVGAGPRRGPPPVAATSWPRGPGSPPSRPPTRSPPWPTGSTC